MVELGVGLAKVYSKVTLRWMNNLFDLGLDVEKGVKAIPRTIEKGSDQIDKVLKEVYDYHTVRTPKK